MEAEKKLTGYPSIDKPWLKYYTEEAINANIPETTIYKNIYEANKDHVSDIALMYFGKKITYGSLFDQIDKTANALKAHGVKQGDNVAICMPAIPETIYTILALNKMGANANMLNPTFTAVQLTDRINETEAKLLITVNELYSIVKDVVPHTTIREVVVCPAVNCLGTIAKLVKKAKKIPGTVVWNAFIRSGKNTSAEETPSRPNRSAIMVYSSGTTGASKGIQLTNDSINATITDGGNIGFSWKRQDRWFSQVPIWFSTGICASTLVPMKYGITVILEPLYDFTIFYNHISKYKPNFMITAVGLLEYLSSAHSQNIAYSNFYYCVAGGEYITPYTEDKLNSWLKTNGSTQPIHKGYGMCECGGTVTSTHYKCNVKGSAGIPTPHVTVSAFDLDTNEELTYGNRGEIRVLTPCRMLEYYKNPEATARFFHTDESGNVWACTGDMGYVTEDGCVYVSGRLSDSYTNENGELIYLFDIERAVLDISEVRQCKAVVSEVNGKMIHVCHTVLDKQADCDIILERIAVHCKEKLPESCIPKLFKFHQNGLPVAPSGKLDIQSMKNDVESLIDVMVKNT